MAPLSSLPKLTATTLSLAGKQCVITGGSRGIGLAIAKLFAAQGARCTLVARSPGGLRSALGSLPFPGDRSPKPSHRYWAVDVSNPDDWTTAMTKDVEELKKGRIDILVNAAGISQNSLLYRTGPSEVGRILDTNLKGTIIACQHVIPRMMRQRRGCIINISSILATHGGRGASVYAASKAGVIGFTRSLAWEVGRFNIRANVIQPGYIQTDMTKAMDNDVDPAALIPMGRLGTVEEVADAALFLAKNSYAHNCVLNIDGGLSAT